MSFHMIAPNQCERTHPREDWEDLLRLYHEMCEKAFNQPKMTRTSPLTNENGNSHQGFDKVVPNCYPVSKQVALCQQL